MTRKVWVPTGNLAWRNTERSGFLPTCELVQEVVEVEIDDDKAEYTGNFEWRPIPILPENPQPPTREDFWQTGTHITNTKAADQPTDSDPSTDT